MRICAIRSILGSLGNYCRKTDSALNLGIIDHPTRKPVITNMLHTNFNIRVLPLISTMLAVGILGGCSSSDDNDNDATQSTPSAFVGTWASGCFQIDADEYSDETIAITANTFAYTFNIHDEADCSDAPIVAASGTLEGTYAEFNDNTTDGGLVAREVEYTVLTTTLIDGTVIDGPLNGQIIQDIVYIDAAGFLYFGDEDFDFKVQERPTALNLDLPFTRQ